MKSEVEVSFWLTASDFSFYYFLFSHQPSQIPQRPQAASASIIFVVAPGF
jgi:hypothetical protein